MLFINRKIKNRSIGSTLESVLCTGPESLAGISACIYFVSAVQPVRVIIFSKIRVI